MSEITEEQKEVIRELRRRLKGKCGNVCPMQQRIKGVSKKYRDITVWNCFHCEAYFGWLSPYETGLFCPCHLIPYETIDLRFSELLDEPI